MAPGLVHPMPEEDLGGSGADPGPLRPSLCYEQSMLMLNCCIEHANQE